MSKVTQLEEGGASPDPTHSLLQSPCLSFTSHCHHCHPPPHPAGEEGKLGGGAVAPMSRCTLAKPCRQSDLRENVCIKAQGREGRMEREGGGVWRGWCGESWHLRGADSRRGRGTEVNSPSAAQPISPSRIYLALSRAPARFWHPVPGLSAEEMGQGGG